LECPYKKIKGKKILQKETIERCIHASKGILTNGKGGTNRSPAAKEGGGEKQGRLAPGGRVERSARAAVPTAEKRSGAPRAELTIPHRNSLPLCPFLLAAMQFYYSSYHYGAILEADGTDRSLIL
jgi:hypothetical protein